MPTPRKDFEEIKSSMGKHSAKEFVKASADKKKSVAKKMKSEFHVKEYRRHSNSPIEGFDVYDKKHTLRGSYPTLKQAKAHKKGSSGGPSEAEYFKAIKK